MDSSEHQFSNPGGGFLKIERRKFESNTKPQVPGMSLRDPEFRRESSGSEAPHIPEMFDSWVRQIGSSSLDCQSDIIALAVGSSENEDLEILVGIPRKAILDV